MLVGIIGGGQLGRMLALAGANLGLRFRIYDPSPVAPARFMAEHFEGEFQDTNRLLEFTRGLDCATYEFENVPLQAAQAVAQHTRLFPGPLALEVSQDRWEEKNFFGKLGIPTAKFFAVNNKSELELAAKELGRPGILKTRRLGYDGKGQASINSPQESGPAWQEIGDVPAILEERLEFKRELSIISVRARNGEIKYYPLIENHHAEGILRFSLAPAPNLDSALTAQAQKIAQKVLESLGYIGVLTIELFEVNGELLANEMAPRVHNSGHWTIDGSMTSQFENHLRAGLGLPIGSIEGRGYSVMQNIIGELPDTASILGDPTAHIHLYDKAPRPKRKLGHITYSCESSESQTSLFKRVNSNKIK